MKGIRHLAEHLNISIGTVSRALNGRPDVNEETRRRVLDAALDGDAPWLMYEYVGGGNLTDLIHRWQTLPPSDRERCVIAAMTELSAAVATFHRLTTPIVGMALIFMALVIYPALGAT